MKKNAPSYIKFIILAAAAALFAFGALSGEPNDVYRKAAMVCPECIGIG